MATDNLSSASKTLGNVVPRVLRWIRCDQKRGDQTRGAWGGRAIGFRAGPAVPGDALRARGACRLLQSPLLGARCCPGALSCLYFPLNVDPSPSLPSP